MPPHRPRQHAAAVRRRRRDLQLLRLHRGRPDGERLARPLDGHHLPGHRDGHHPREGPGYRRRERLMDHDL